MKTAKTKPPKSASASALIIAVILTSLLAIIGVMFVMIARVDKMATSSISVNKELNFAVEAVVAKISQELVLDVPRSDSNGVELSEYYDYPGNEDKWLASLEPYDAGVGNYRWRRISDIYDRLDANNLQAEIITDYQLSIAEDVNADADGDGIADSRWIKLGNMTSNKGKPIYAAVRVVDNGAMLNVNTAYKFDPNAARSEIDGSSQMQINLEGFARVGCLSNPDTIQELSLERSGSPIPTADYERKVVWGFTGPFGAMNLPFDISDELAIHGRYIIKQRNTITRLKRVWECAFDRSVGYTKETPYTGDLPNWFEKAYRHPSEPNIQQYYNMPHISTAYNIDRIITPDCSKMTNINNADVNELYSSIRRGLLDTNYPDINGVTAQIAVNLKDYADSDSNVTPFTPDVNGLTYYGFEQPCIYISEFAQRFRLIPGHEPPSTINDYYTSYAIELYKRYAADDDPCNWQLKISGLLNPIQINNWKANEQFYVIRKHDPCAPLDVNTSAGTTIQPETFSFTGDTVVDLQRPVPGGGYITVDSKQVPGGWFNFNNVARSLQRDITLHKCIRRLWAGFAEANSPTLGIVNGYFSSDPNVIQAHPESKPFTNVGEIGMVFNKPAYYEAGQPIPSSDVIGYGSDSDVESEVRLNLADPNLQQLFKYLTVFDPYNFYPGDANYTDETRIKGRININTAPWYVLAQLPWVSQRNGYDDANLARAIVAYRDKLNLTPDGPDYSGTNGRETGTGIIGLREELGFANIGELVTVVNNSGKDNYSMSYYIMDVTEKGIDLAGFPDLTPGGFIGDGVPDDFEERDVIFARISNLVTVRSDVFTAYILVRIGEDGPQKRVMAILDRSNVYSPTDKVRVIVLHPVPDPR